MIAGTHHDGNRGSAWDLVADLTPLVDVLFMLIIFMVLTANSAQLSIDAQIPNTEETSLSAPPDRTALMVQINHQGSAFEVDGVAIATWSEAKGALRAMLTQPSERPVVIAAHPDAPVQRMVDVMSFLQNHGALNASILMEPR